MEVVYNFINFGLYKLCAAEVRGRVQNLDLRFGESEGKKVGNKVERFKSGERSEVGPVSCNLFSEEFTKLKELPHGLQVPKLVWKQ